MAEYEYLYEEIDISGDLIPCEFCGDLFPIGVFIEHSSGCAPGHFLGSGEQEHFLGSGEQEHFLGSGEQEHFLGSGEQEHFLGSGEQEHFLGSGEPDPTPKVATKLAEEPVTKPQIPPKPSTFSKNYDEKVLFPKTNNNSSIKIEQLITNDVYDIKPKSGGGSVMKKLSNLENEKIINIKTPYIHFKTGVQEQDESDSDDDDDDDPPRVGPEQAKAFSSDVNSSSRGVDVQGSMELSDDNNEENETIESFLRRASIELSKIKQCHQRAETKWKESKYTRYDSEDTYQCQETRNIYYQDCY